MGIAILLSVAVLFVGTFIGSYLVYEVGLTSTQVVPLLLWAAWGIGMLYGVLVAAYQLVKIRQLMLQRSGR